MSQNNHVQDTLTLEEVYDKYHRLVTRASFKFLKKLPDEQMDDLTQEAWEEIVTHYPNRDCSIMDLENWIIQMTHDKLYRLVREQRAEKRLVSSSSISIDELFMGRGKDL